MRKRTVMIVLAVLGIAVISRLAPSAQACSRVFLNLDPKQMIAGRTMDLYIDDKPRLVYFPRGLKRDGAALANAAHWISKYASIGVTSLDAGTTDGMNEKGLSAHLLYLHESEYEPADGRPVISNAIWAQYVLDNCATVAEALDLLSKVRVAARSAGGREWPLHLAMEDAGGDSAVIEYVKGKVVVHHGKNITVMTNDPVLDEQLNNLKKYKLFGGKLSMPGDIDPLSRFVRAASYLKTLPKPEGRYEAVAYVGGVLRTTMVPFGSLDTSSEVPAVDTWPTRWATITDISNRRFYFLSTRSPNVVWIDLKKLSVFRNMQAITPNSGLSGEISGKFKKYTPKTKQYPPAF